MNDHHGYIGETHVSTQNPCKLCSPLGASLAIKGIRGAVPLLHGSQGCSTYIRRYLISHFREPIDIASSNFGENTAIFGGSVNLKLALSNIISQYRPEMIGVATTCLSETIGDDVRLFIREFLKNQGSEAIPPIVHIPTPSYSGTHMTGFHRATLEIVRTLAQADGMPSEKRVNLFPGMLSAADLRCLTEITADFGLNLTLLPDYSQTMDGGLWSVYQKIPVGGTGIEAVQKAGSAAASLQFGRIVNQETESAAAYLEKSFQVPWYRLGLPIGILETDRFFETLEALSGIQTPAKYREERGRLTDAYVDGHKYISGIRAAVYGEEDLVAGLSSFLAEIGVIPVILASGGHSGHLESTLSDVLEPEILDQATILTGRDFKEIEAAARQLEPDIFIGNSKGYSITRQLNIPLVRVGFPIHDRIGGHRIVHVGYRGAQELFDTIVNAVLERRQTASSVGYSYM